MVGNADLVGQRTEHAPALFQGREGPGPEALVLGVELFEDVEPGLLLGLLADELVEFVPGRLEFLLKFAQTGLPFLDRAARGLDAELLRFDVDLEFREAGIEMRGLLLHLDLLGAELFQADDVALLLEVERVDLVPGAGKLLAVVERLGLGAAQGIGHAAEIRLDGLDVLTPFLQRSPL